MFQTLTLTLPTSVLKLHSPHPSSRSALPFPTRSVNLNCRATVQDHRGTSAVSDSGNAATLYEVLMVNRDASTTEIKAAYRTLAKLHHPDATDGRSDGQDFIQIHQAYETLSDPATRAMYDLTLRLGGRVGTLPSMSFGRDFVIRRRPPGFYPTRRWETDQCW